MSVEAGRHEWMCRFALSPAKKSRVTRQWDAGFPIHGLLRGRRIATKTFPDEGHLHPRRAQSDSQQFERAKSMLARRRFFGVFRRGLAFL